MYSVSAPPTVVRWTKRLEEAGELDGAVHKLEPLVTSIFATGTRGAVLRGDWLGHALHPSLTDAVLGSWASASVLDVLGRGKWSEPAQTLVGLGVIGWFPTAWSGWAEWTQAGPREKRVGLVHVLGNATALGAYAASWFARRRGDHGRGVRLALLGAAVSSAAGYLGGHLASARKVGSHHPAFAEATPPETA